MTGEGEPAANTQAAGSRLETWKEIAAYLRRDVRTVQRWEQTDGLPIHRHQRAHRPIPYAYTAELDAWWTGRPDAVAPSPSTRDEGEARSWRAPVVAVVALSLAALVGGFVLWAARSRPPATPSVTVSTAAIGGPAEPGIAPQPRSVAVLPFGDLTEGMTHEEFADGMAEEIISRLNARPGYRVPAAASTFYFKNKDVPVAEIARALRVAFVVDGSVRRSGPTVRVAARLIRADGGDVVWSETFDRPWSDVLRLQDDVAGAAAAAITRAIESTAGPGG